MSGLSEHDHDHGHSNVHAHAGKGSEKAILRAIGITFIFMAIEVVGAIAANSLALLSDAAHMLTDVGAMLFSLFALWVARKPSTPTMSFGYHRAEILGALASGLVIWLLSGVLVYEAILRLASPPEVKGPILFVVAFIGLGANLLSMGMLHSAKKENLNIRAAYLHVLADSLGSVGAVIAGLTLWLTHWRPIDPIVTLLFAILMLVSSWELVKEAVGILMESTPAHVDPERVRADLGSLQGVREVHDLHIWTVTSGRLALSAHLIASGTENLLGRANDLLKERYGIVHTTVQVESPNEFSSERCYDCAPVEFPSMK